MAGIKQLIKKTPLIKVWRYCSKQRELHMVETFNKEYKHYIDPLMDPIVLEESIISLKKKTISEHIYYVISFANPRIGIYGYINNIIPHIAYAIAKGYIPVIDMQNHPSLYQKGTENAWERFFEQPCGIGLDDIRNGQIIVAPNTFWYRWGPNSCPLMSDDETRMWGRIYQEFIRHNQKTTAYLSDEMSSILTSPQKTLGTLYRGTDYTKGHATGHPIQPSMQKFADTVEAMLNGNGYEYIYLASDERGIVEYMNQRFPRRILINKRVYYDEAENVDYSNYNYDHIGISGARFDREDNEYLIGIEYISSMNLVATCDAFVAGACGGTTAVLYLNNLRFKETQIFNLGRYGFDPIPEG